MDFVTFIIIGILIYSFLGRKNKPPQRTARSAEEAKKQARPRPQQPSKPERKREGFFESLERQIRESAEELERELKTGGDEKTVRPTRQASRKLEPKRAPAPEAAYEGVEGAWGVEGRSDYGRHQSKQGRLKKDKTAKPEKDTGIREELSLIEQTAIQSSDKVFADSERKNLETALGFSSSEIVQGVVWAEILKEPRGRRPFSRKVI